ncbi:MAG: acylphosphatase [Candidatus Paceibacterota bacterium]
MKERLECRITGRVQLVMFRDFTQRKASALGLGGTVENKRDGSVVVVAEGEHSKLEQLLLLLRSGSILSRVDNVEAKWLDATGEFSDFKIVYYGNE